ncbi:ECF transporter S component [Pontibacillus litoralis]|uniref:Metal ABC transporter permease n=1 Tax=Pontibacillus litoralis JSM 072002 TaxID=1385512 RepID=A0A0A5HQR0_9BACI|nr:ECF transporter S component [Pontibacillus litoralis]KGX85952.1 hypothetical protein N784_06160 [Pontibacillus litoralis JSM 072002]
MTYKNGNKVYQLTLIALLAALGTVGRFVFNFAPNIQPVTALIIICGLWLGPVAGITLAVLSTILSNMLLGMGIWTISQIVAWAMIGLLSGLLGKYREKLPLWFIALFGAFAGYFYGFMLSLAYGAVGNHFIAYYIAGLPFDTNHALGNVVFIVVLYPVLSKLFRRFKYQHPFMTEASSERERNKSYVKKSHTE